MSLVWRPRVNPDRINVAAQTLRGQLSRQRADTLRATTLASAAHRAEADVQASHATEVLAMAECVLDWAKRNHVPRNSTSPRGWIVGSYSEDVQVWPDFRDESVHINIVATRWGNYYKVIGTHKPSSDVDFGKLTLGSVEASIIRLVAESGVPWRR